MDSQQRVSKTEVSYFKHIDQRQSIIEGSVIKGVKDYVYVGKRMNLAETDSESKRNKQI